MNRIDRLTAIILMLQSHRVITAEQIAEHFEISIRTVYRDMTALGEAGVPIISEAGVGYTLMRGYHMPPVMFTKEEAASLFMCSELTKQLGDKSLKESLRGAMLKIRSALSVENKDYLNRLSRSIRIVPSQAKNDTNSFLMQLQEAVVRHQCVELEYDTASRGDISKRVVEPLGVIFYGRHWHLIAWCQMRNDFRDFRVDRIKRCLALQSTFERHDSFSLMDFLDGEVCEHELIHVELECEPWAFDKVLADIPAQLVGQPFLSNGKFQIKALAYSLDWMAYWVMGLGKAITVHEPEALQKKLITAARELVKHHKNSIP